MRSHRTVDPLVILTAVAGGGLAVQARLNGELGVRLGSPLTAGAVNFLVGLGVVALAATARRVPFRRTATRWWHWTGGLCAVAFVYSVIVAVPRLGVSMVGVCTAAGMTAAALLADTVGLGVAGKHPLEARRVAGALIAVAAVGVSGLGATDGGAEWRYVALALAGGFAMGCQQPINTRLAGALGDGGLAAVVSFAVGTAAIVTLAATDLPGDGWPTDPWLYTGGALAAAYVLIAIPAVSRAGALRVSLATLTGQLTAAALLDLVAPVGDERLTATTLAGLVLAAAAVALATRGSVLRSGAWPRSGSS